MGTHAIKMVMGITAGLLIAGCGSFRQAPKPVFKYTLSYPTLNKTVENQLPTIIKVDRFAAAPGYDSSRMIYAASQLERNAYTYHHWFAPPAEMVAAALVRDLRASKAFSAIAQPGDGIQYTHVLSGGIIEFFEKEETLSRKAVLSVSILVFTNERSYTSQKILLQKQYRVEADCRGRNVADFAEAMNRAVQTFSKQLIYDLYEAIADQKNIDSPLSNQTNPASTDKQ